MGTLAVEEPLAQAAAANGAPLRRLRILLAEDNIVNQKLAVRLLEKRGHVVAVVGDGKEAIEALDKDRFDLVLMDVQMPQMDGFEATALIRESEATTGVHLPIIAMTAHAMKGDRERCLGAGFDGYVPKPVRSQELFDAIEMLVGVPPPTDGAVPQEAPMSESLVDRSVALARVDGDLGLLKEIVGLFMGDFPKLMAEIRTAVQNRDAAKLRRAAHTLKGSVGNFGAARAVEAALVLEMMGKSGDLSGVEAAHARLEDVMARVGPELAALVPEGMLPA